MFWQRYRHYDFFPPPTAKKPKGGIKTQSKRGTLGQTWWGNRWVQVLERFNIGARLGRGRSYDGCATFSLCVFSVGSVQSRGLRFVDVAGAVPVHAVRENTADPLGTITNPCVSPVENRCPKD